MGQPEKPRQIWLGGYSWPVNSSFEAALRNLGFKDEMRTLWVDALCINQNDAADRTAQIQKMRRICRPGARGVSNATDCRDRLYTLVGTSTDDGEIVPDHSNTGEMVFVDYAKLDITKGPNLKVPPRQPHHAVQRPGLLVDPGTPQGGD
ncbi:hypothetical protein DL767_000571 [Monosporascus sp. MG133]|nr:hypothetical protein DL767_000571 [Monosporascus sp. MG133]